jgi:hypothetical protein
MSIARPTRQSFSGGLRTGLIYAFRRTHGRLPSSLHDDAIITRPLPIAATAFDQMARQFDRSVVDTTITRCRSQIATVCGI